MPRKRTKSDRSNAALKGWRTRRKNQREERGRPVTKRGHNKTAMAPAKSKGKKYVRRKNRKLAKKSLEKEKTGQRISKTRSKARIRPKPTKTGKRTPAQQKADRRRTNKLKRRSAAAKKGWRTRRARERKKAKHPAAPKLKPGNQEYIVTTRKTRLHGNGSGVSLDVIWESEKKASSVINFCITWLEKKDNNLRWAIPILIYAENPEVFEGPLTSKNFNVTLRR